MFAAEDNATAVEVLAVLAPNQREVRGWLDQQEDCGWSDLKNPRSQTEQWENRVASGRSGGLFVIV